MSTLLHKAVEDKKFDVRLIERSIERGLLKREDAKQFAERLSDDAENAEWINLEEFLKDSGKGKK